MVLFPLKPLIDELIEERAVMLFNTHSYFDQCGDTSKFNKMYIHENEVNEIFKLFDTLFLKNSPNQIVKLYKGKNFVILGAKDIH